ncbi:MAG: hypothetical protein ACO1Q7_09095 [Gemmatimonas sp.]
MKLIRLFASATIALVIASSPAMAQTARPGMMDSVSKQMNLGKSAAKSAKSSGSATAKATRKPAVGELVSGSEARPVAKTAPAVESPKSAPPVKRAAPIAKKKPPVK